MLIGLKFLRWMSVPYNRGSFSRMKRVELTLADNLGIRTYGKSLLDQLEERSSKFPPVIRFISFIPSRCLCATVHSLRPTQSETCRAVLLATSRSTTQPCGPGSQQRRSVSFTSSLGAISHGRLKD